MIRCVAAIDSERGFATPDGIPWKLPTDKVQWRKLVNHDFVLMGHNTYSTHLLPLSDMPNFVLSYDNELNEGFFAINDVDRFLEKYGKVMNISIIGGESVFKAGLKWCDSLWLTIIEGKHGCNRFFPEFSDFRLVYQSETFYENGDSYNFTRWDRQ